MVYEYSNLGYGVLDEVIRREGGVDYAAFIRQRVFLPLDLTRTAVHVPSELASFAAQRYWPDGTPIPYYDFDHDGGSAVYSSAHDLVRFGMFHLGVKVRPRISWNATSASLARARADTNAARNRTPAGKTEPTGAPER